MWTIIHFERVRPGIYSEHIHYKSFRWHHTRASSFRKVPVGDIFLANCILIFRCFANVSLSSLNARLCSAHLGFYRPTPSSTPVLLAAPPTSTHTLEHIHAIIVQRWVYASGLAFLRRCGRLNHGRRHGAFRPAEHSQRNSGTKIPGE